MRGGQRMLPSNVFTRDHSRVYSRQAIAKKPHGLAIRGCVVALQRNVVSAPFYNALDRRSYLQENANRMVLRFENRVLFHWQLRSRKGVPI